MSLQAQGRFAAFQQAFKETFGWTLQKIVLPLSPFLMGALLRYFISGRISVEIFNGAELAFSMSLLCILIIENVNRLRDKELAQSLSTLFTMATFVFLLLFYLQLNYEIELNQIMSKGVAHLQEKRDIAATISLTELEFIQDPRLDEYPSRMKQARLATFFCTLIVIPSAIIVKRIYKLESQ